MHWRVGPQSLFIREVLRNEFNYWQAFALLEPFGSNMIEGAKIQSAIWSCGAHKYYPPEDFLPCLKKIVDPNDPEQLKKDEEKVLLFMRAAGVKKKKKVKHI